MNTFREQRGAASDPDSSYRRTITPEVKTSVERLLPTTTPRVRVTRLSPWCWYLRPPLLAQRDLDDVRPGLVLDARGGHGFTVDPKASRQWTVDAAGIRSAIHADFSKSIERSWDRYDATLRSADKLLDHAARVSDLDPDNLLNPDGSAVRRGLFATSLPTAQLAADDLTRKAGGGNAEALAHAEAGEFDDAWADVMRRADRTRRQIDDALLSER